MQHPPRVLVVVENQSAPFDRRVANISRSLVQAGCEVTVLSPRGVDRDVEPEAVWDGVRSVRYPQRFADSARGYPREYAVAMWQTLVSSLRLGWRRPFDVVHVCNPPDIMLLAVLPLRLRGTRLIYDQHDLVPELFGSRFGGRPRWLVRVLTWLERMSYHLADHVIVTNESYRRTALSRGHLSPETVTIVRNGPDAARFTPLPPDPTLRRGKAHLLAFVGVMGHHDGVDRAVRAVAQLRRSGRDDVHAVFIGTGDTRDACMRLADELGIADITEFPGYLPDDYLCRWLSTADVCLAPDPPSPLNDVSTMTKVMDYMALGRPIVSFDLPETRFTARNAAVYAPGEDVAAFARLIEDLLDDPARRSAMGDEARARATGPMSWQTSRQRLLEVYDRLLGRNVRHVEARPSMKAAQ